MTAKKRKTVRVMAGDNRTIPIPKGACPGGSGARYFPTSADKAIEVFADHPFVVRSLRPSKVKLGKEGKAPIADLLAVAKAPPAPTRAPAPSTAKVKE